MNSSYVRNLSGMENLYRTFEIENAFYINCVIDFESLLDDINWPAVIDESLKSNPGASVELTSSLFFKKWTYSDKGAPFCETKFAGTLEDALFAMPNSLSEKGPSCDVWKIIYTGGVALVFRSLHSVMDGNGLWGWFTDCIRIANNLPPVGHEAAINDIELSSRLNFSTEGNASSGGVYKPLTSGGAVQPKPFYSFTIPGTARGLSKKLCHLFKRYAQANNISELHFFIPSDLRKYDNSIHSTGNLTGILEVKFTSSTSDEDITRYIKEKIELKSDARYVQRMNFLRFLSIRVLKKLLSIFISRHNHAATGLLSNLGDINSKEVTIKGACPRNVFYIAPCSGFHPMLVVCGSYKNQLTLTFSFLEHLQGDAYRLVNFIKEGLAADGGLIN